MRNIIKKLGTLIGIRRTLNFIEGSNITLTIDDNTSTKEVDITIASTGGSLSGTANTVAYFNTTTSIASLSTTTYPSLTELSYVKGLTSAVQTQINNKQDSLVSGTNIKSINSNSLIGSGNVTIDKTSVGLGNVDNTSDANKPVSTAQSTAIGLKQDTLVSGTNIKTITGISVLGSGNIYPTQTSASAFITAETAISTATYADITGASISLSAGTWIIYGNIICRATNTAILAHAAITDNSNVIVAEASQGCPASGNANVNQYININITAIVTPSTTTTYKLRAARGNTTITGSFTVVDGAGVGTTNNVSDNLDKGTSIIALRIA